MKELHYRIRIKDDVYEMNGSDELALWIEGAIIRMLHSRIAFPRSKRTLECEWIPKDKSSE